MTTLERLQELLTKEFAIDRAKLTPDARLEDLDIDSLRMIEILFCVEDEFRITVAADQAELKAKLHTFGDLAGYIDTVIAEQGKQAGAAAS